MTALMLGTAQWGNAYGATNTVGRLTDRDISEIVACAREAGITEVDTAQGYGDAELRLRPYARDFAMTTKVPGRGDVMALVQKSLANLDLASVSSVLIHDWDSLDRTESHQCVASLHQLVQSGLVERVGVSVYDAAGLERAIESFSVGNVPLAAVQVPANVLDRRLDTSPLLGELASRGTQVVVRSVFLQGILLANSGGLANHEDLVRIRTDAHARGVSLMQTCLAHVKALPWASHVVIGVTSALELREVVTAWEGCLPTAAPSEWESSDEFLMDPRCW